VVLGAGPSIFGCPFGSSGTAGLGKSGHCAASMGAIATATATDVTTSRNDFIFSLPTSENDAVLFNEESGQLQAVAGPGSVLIGIFVEPIVQLSGHHFGGSGGRE